ncbi:LysR family transcriptional regulator [Paraburkholderia heleia]|uniref:LysR family transcriptional regulator n=1 Tax=Paraburkholderia heleia TaxID=634127 RepID=UPI0005A7C504|nr:LysR family transcriptional regulator [Paraburkholderia heleia]
MNIPPTNELVAFQKVANRLSFRKASEELNVTPSTLSHLIRSLEERLKTRLLNRTTRSVALTEPGRKLFVQLNAIPGNLSDVLEGLHEEAGRAGPYGSILARWRPGFSKKINHNGLVIEAAIKGLGIAHLPVALIEDELSAKRLVVLLDDWCQSLPGLCLYYPKNRHLPLAFRCLLGILKGNV